MEKARKKQLNWIIIEVFLLLQVDFHSLSTFWWFDKYFGHIIEIVMKMISCHKMLLMRIAITMSKSSNKTCHIRHSIQLFIFNQEVLFFNNYHLLDFQIRLATLLYVDDY